MPRWSRGSNDLYLYTLYNPMNMPSQNCKKGPQSSHSVQYRWLGKWSHYHAYLQSWVVCFVVICNIDVRDGCHLLGLDGHLATSYTYLKRRRLKSSWGRGYQENWRLRLHRVAVWSGLHHCIITLITSVMWAVLCFNSTIYFGVCNFCWFIIQMLSSILIVDVPGWVGYYNHVTCFME